jgi:hypothetical protein
VLRWSQTSASGRLLAIGVVQPHLATLSDLESSDSDGPELFTQAEGELPLGSKLKPVPPTSPPKTHPLRPNAGTSSPEPPPAPLPPRPEPPKQRGVVDPATAGGSLDRFQRLQESSWASRPEKAVRHARVAFFHWDLDETYRHPLFDGCLRDFPKHACLDSGRREVKHPEQWNEPGMLASCAEHRRRALLRAVLRACGTFKVDMLVLPEYSIRPETANWLIHELPDLAPSTSVWAGTYRQPPNMELRLSTDGEQPPAWSAVMPIILAPLLGETAWRVQLRKKKYPAVAVGEVFCPAVGPLEPEFKASSAQFDPRAYSNELICSEVFLVTSPANLLGMVHAFQRLLVNFNAQGPQRTPEDMENQVVEDIRHFARYTSLSHAHDQPRLLLLVPAMTTRSKDFSILGQASFLASAVTTVFCNAVAGRFGCGESCIIGHDCWGKEDKTAAGFPEPGPYHGSLPGIYHPEHFNSGRLGKREQALVIADVDPVYSPEGKPRPQMLPPPLSLVAHLPIIESTTPGDAKAGTASGKGTCRCQRGRDCSGRVRGLAGQLLAAFSTVTGNTGNDRSPQDLARLLKELENLACTTEEAREEQSGWLRERRKAYLREHLASPRQWPPPVALDWLFVDLSETHDGLPMLEVPPYSLAPGEQPQAEDT